MLNKFKATYGIMILLHKYYSLKLRTSDRLENNKFIIRIEYFFNNDKISSHWVCSLLSISITIKVHAL